MSGQRWRMDVLSPTGWRPVEEGRSRWRLALFVLFVTFFAPRDEHRIVWYGKRLAEPDV